MRSRADSLPRRPERPSPKMDTGFPEWDARSDFDRQRRRQALSRIAARLRLRPASPTMLPFDSVVAALGRRAEQDLGLVVIPTASVVGSVDRRPESFDRAFRPRAPELRQRWERIAAARRRGEALPPIDVYRIGDAHFVRDGHHRVSVARALGETTIEARVREVRTSVAPPPELRASQDDGRRLSRPRTALRWVVELSLGR